MRRQGLLRELEMNPEVVKLMRAEGVGYQKSCRLIDEFGSYNAVKSASRAQLQDVHGIGPVLSWRIKPMGELLPADLTKEELE